MNPETLKLCQWVLATAKKSGAAECRVSANVSRQVELTYRERKPETVKEAAIRGLSIEIYVDSRYSTQSTSDLRQDSLRPFIANAVEVTRLLGEDPYRCLPDPKYYQGRVEKDLRIRDPGYSQLAPRERHERVKQIEDAALRHGGDKVISVTAYGTDQLNETLVLTSNGFQGVQESTDFSHGAVMTVRDRGDRRPEAYFFVNQRLRTALLSPDEIGRKVAQQASRLLGAQKIKTERLPIIVENQHVPRLLQGLLDPMSGRAIQQKSSFLADKKGQKIASECLSVIDDPLLPEGQASGLWDGDGFPARRRTMVEAGVLKEFYVDWYYSRKLGWEPTTGGSSNLIIPPGTRSVEAIMKDLRRGIMVTGFIGGNSNSTTGDTSVGITGSLFEGGALVQPVAEMNIADNHLEFWKKLREVANDPWLHGAWRAPSLVFSDVVVSGL